MIELADEDAFDDVAVFMLSSTRPLAPLWSSNVSTIVSLRDFFDAISYSIVVLRGWSTLSYLEKKEIFILP